MESNKSPDLEKIKTSDKKKKKRSHTPSEYNMFVKKHYDSVRSIKGPQDRMRKLGEMWRKHKKEKKDVVKSLKNK